MMEPSSNYMSCNEKSKAEKSPATKTMDEPMEVPEAEEVSGEDQMWDDEVVTKAFQDEVFCVPKESEIKDVTEAGELPQTEKERSIVIVKEKEKEKQREEKKDDHICEKTVKPEKTARNSELINSNIKGGAKSKNKKKKRSKRDRPKSDRDSKKKKTSERSQSARGRKKKDNLSSQERRKKKRSKTKTQTSSISKKGSDSVHKKKKEREKSVRDRIRNRMKTFTKSTSEKVKMYTKERKWFGKVRKGDDTIIVQGEGQEYIISQEDLGIGQSVGKPCAYDVDNNNNNGRIFVNGVPFWQIHQPDDKIPVLDPTQLFSHQLRLVTAGYKECKNTLPEPPTIEDIAMVTELKDLMARDKPYFVQETIVSNTIRTILHNHDDCDDNCKGAQVEKSRRIEPPSNLPTVHISEPNLQTSYTRFQFSRKTKNFKPPRALQAADGSSTSDHSKSGSRPKIWSRILRNKSKK